MATALEGAGMRAWLARVGGLRRLLIIGLVCLVALDVVLWLKLDSSASSSAESQQDPSASGRFASGQLITLADLQRLQWQEIGEAVGVIGDQSGAVKRVIRLSEGVD